MSQRKLLADNTDRAADNRWAKEDSSRRKKTTTAATTPDPTTSATPAKAEEDRGGGSPEPNRPNDPTAQRKKEDFNVFILDAPFRFDDEVEYFGQQHTEYRTQQINRRTSDPADFFIEVIEHPYTVLNSYRTANHTWYAHLQKETGNSRQLILADKYEILNRLTHFNWTFRQKSQGLSEGSYWAGTIPNVGDAYWYTPGIPGIVASPAPLPGTLDDWFYPKAKVVIGGFPTKKHDPSYNSPDRFNFVPSFSASNGRYIWYTTVYLERPPSTGFERVGSILPGSRLRDETVYPTDSRNTGAPNYHAHYTVRKELQEGSLLHKNFIDPYYIGGVTGVNFPTVTNLTWRFDTDVRAEDFNPEPLRTVTVLPNPYNFFNVDREAYLNSLDGAHPMKERWETRKAITSDPQGAAQYFFEEDFPLYHENLVYYKDTGLMIYTEVLKKDDLWGSIPRIYTKKIEPNQQYFIVHAFEMPGGTSFNKFLTTHETMLASGWKEASRKLSPNFSNDQSFRPIYHYTHRTSPKQ